MASATPSSSSNFTRQLKNYHPATNLNKLFEDPSANADVNFVFPDECETIVAHKCLLAIASPVFQTMFFGQLKEVGDIRIVDATPHAFREFLQFFYCDKIELTQENIQEVLTLADKYDVSGLMNMCGIYLEFLLNNQTVSWVYELAIMFELTHLTVLCKERISSETAAILATPAFRTCSKLVLGRILDSDNLTCDEYMLFRSAMDWAAESCKRSGIEPTPVNRKLELGPCFQQIRFPTMTSEEFTRCIAEPGLFDATEFLSILSYLTLRRDIGNAIVYSKEPRNGTPTWTAKESEKSLIMFCDRRSMPSLHRLVPFEQDVTVFTVNERILLGQIAFSTFKTSGTEQKIIEGRMEVKRKESPEDLLYPDTDETDAEHDATDALQKPVYTTILQQTVSVSSTGFTKLLLSKPLVLLPFVEYQIHTEWDLEPGDMLVFRTGCRAEVMLDGGVRFQFYGYEPLRTHDNIEEGILCKMYFKKW